MPLVFHWPAAERDTRTEAPQLVDVAPTILELLGLPPLPRPTAPAWCGCWTGSPRNTPAYETRLPFTYYGWAPRWALREAGAKLIEPPLEFQR